LCSFITANRDRGGGGSLGDNHLFWGCEVILFGTSKRHEGHGHAFEMLVKIVRACSTRGEFASKRLLILSAKAASRAEEREANWWTRRSTHRGQQFNRFHTALAALSRAKLEDDTDKLPEQFLLPWPWKQDDLDGVTVLRLTDGQFTRWLASATGEGVELRQHPHSSASAEPAEHQARGGSSSVHGLPSHPKGRRKMLSFEFFSGTRMFSHSMKVLGADCHSQDHELDEKLKPIYPEETKHHKCEFESPELDKQLRALPPLDVSLFAFECKTYSTQGMGAHGRCNANPLGTTECALAANSAVDLMLDRIQDQLKRNPKHASVIENPEGGMALLPSIRDRLEKSREDGGLGAVRCLVSQCFFQSPFRKHTHLWVINSPSLVRFLGEDDPVKHRFVCGKCRQSCGRDHENMEGRSREAAAYSKSFALMLATHLALDVRLSNFEID
jgi:hypothetical protein